MAAIHPWVTDVDSSTAEPMLGYARGVSERPSGGSESASGADRADGKGKGRPRSSEGLGEPSRARGPRIDPDVVIPLTPTDGAEPDRRPMARLSGQLSALVSAANQRGDLIGVIRRARENLPGDPAFGDPLSVSGPGGVRAVARAADKLVGDSPSAARELGLGALQVWQAVLERMGKGRGTAEITIMFTDLVAFSSWSLSAGDEQTLELLRRVAKAIEPPIGERGGHVVKRMGDGVMAVFPSPDRAVRAAVAAKRNLARVDVNGYTPQMRVGLHTGTPRELGGDWLGVDVTIAARVMEAGGNGNTMLSHATLAALEPETLAELGCVPKPYRRSFFAAPLSGVPEDLRIYRLDPE
ncbi:pH-sensitive adenylate cyclase Rv1264 [Nocardia otitidiscaviarum]|uniref:pH-sensitive adenylate cyclase Rv1264 n=3 Tax=Nocardia otitidiscaviarum TaxID=1823 RepID=A0A378Y9M3_9NOCA|nr:pH-sensitive adenylate cyclase Rv1264 [Nocardia otitidiscaviarum]